MVLNEGLKQKIDLIGMLDVMRQREQTEEDRKRKELENEMMELANKANKHKQGLIENITAYKGPGSGLNEPLGWAKYERERNVDKALSAITGNPLPNVGIRGLGGGGGGGPQQDPYSNYAPGQLDQMNAINEYQPQQAKPQAADIASLLGQLYRPGADGGASNLGGGSIKNPETGTFKEFSETPVGNVGTITDLAGNQGVTGVGAAADYKNNLANTEEVNKILKDRAALEEKNKLEKMLYSSESYRRLDYDKQNKARKELPQFLHDLEVRNIPITRGIIDRFLALVDKPEKKTNI